MLYSQRLLFLSIVVVLCAACADATARERCLRLLALSFWVNSRSTCCCVFSALRRLVFLSCCVACSFARCCCCLSARCAFRFFESLLLRLRAATCWRYATSSGRAHCLPFLRLCSAFIWGLWLPCPVMSIAYFLSRGNLVLFWRHYCSPQFLHTFCLPRQAPGYVPLHLLVLSFW